MRPAWPTSCCSNSVAPRMPLCISVRFHTVFCAPVICTSAVVTMLETTSSSPVANSSSMRENPDSSCLGVTVIPLKLRRLERHDRRFRDDAVADRRSHHGDDRDLLHTPRDGDARAVHAGRRDTFNLPPPLVL